MEAAAGAEDAAAVAEEAAAEMRATLGDGANLRGLANVDAAAAADPAPSRSSPGVDGAAESGPKIRARPATRRRGGGG